MRNCVLSCEMELRPILIARRRYVYVTVLLSFFFLSGSLATPALIQLAQDGCGACTGHTLVYECTAVGIGSTVWRGTAFSQCAGNSIILSHSLFATSGTTGSCNSGGIVGYSVGVVGSSYTSQLNVTVRGSMSGLTVRCFYNDGARETEIGEKTITIRQDPLPPPEEIHLASIVVADEGLHITFNWTTMWQSCSAVQYVITSINCGICPSLVNVTQASCLNVAVGSICSFAVHTVTCEAIVEDPINSVSLTALLKVPNPPAVQCVPLYAADTGNLKSITTTFQEAESFTISGKFDGSATSYTITYSDASSGSTCASVTVLPSDCEGGTCSHVFKVADSACPPCVDINTTLFATNLLGNGRPSDTIKISNRNLFVEIDYSTLSSSIQCTFKQQTASTKRCSIMYTPHEDCHSDNHSLASSGEISSTSVSGLNSKTVDLSLNRRSLNASRFCSIVTATDGPTVAKVEGIFNAGCSPQELTDINDTLLPDDSQCGPPLQSLGIRNGVVCYSSLDVGATAVYHCSSCDYGTVGRLSARTCLANGTWNGSIPHCECGSVTSTDREKSSFQLPITAALASVGLVFTVIICILIAVIIMLLRSRSTTRTELKRLQANANVVYDVITAPPAPSIIEAKTNVAYDSVT